MRFIIFTATSTFIRYLEVTLADKLCRAKFNLGINQGPAYTRQLMSTDVTDFLILVQINVYVLNAVCRKRFEQFLCR